MSVPIPSLKGDCGDIGCWVGDLLPGCKLCMEGKKTVVFVTGVCPERCYYCPLSPWRKGRDVFFANNSEVESVEDVIAESVVSGSEGAGITGGDPIARLDRTLEVIRALKEFYGSKYHIHLYTTGILLNQRKLEDLISAGLDELRIHVTGLHSWRAIQEALKYPVTLGIENPSIPGQLRTLKDIVIKAWELGVRYINLNELEFSEGNYTSLYMRGFRPLPGSVAAEGSMDTAVEVMRWVVEEGIDVSIHFCPAVYKDRHQFRRRMELRAMRTRLPYEEVSGATVKWLRVRCPRSFEDMVVLADAGIRDGEYVITHPKVKLMEGCVGGLLEAYPTTPRRVLNETPYPHISGQP
ncbi:MAG: radical SAM protein [Desulfurococcales archaeon]|nr:radical SAM protein [Desulfurococcales archaeon]